MTPACCRDENAVRARGPRERWTPRRMRQNLCPAAMTGPRVPTASLPSRGCVSWCMCPPLNGSLPRGKLELPTGATDGDEGHDCRNGRREPEVLSAHLKTPPHVLDPLRTEESSAGSMAED